MKRLIISLGVTLLVVFLSACSSDSAGRQEEKTTNQLTAAQQQVKQLLSSYYKIKDALVQTDGALASTEAHAMIPLLPQQETSGREAAFGAINTALHTIAGSSDPDIQRQAFQPLSDSLYSVLVRAGGAGETVYRQYCPMAFDDSGAYWLSAEKTILNPYFGDRMLRCGAVKETIE